MPLVTHTFNVGDGNFTVSHSNGVMVINDAGYGSSGHENMYRPGGDLTPLRTAFRDLLRQNNIHTVHTVISHQHSDHSNLLGPIFEEIREEQQDRERLGRLSPLNIGRVVIGGPPSERFEQKLSEIAGKVGDIPAEYIQPGGNNTELRRRLIKADGTFEEGEAISMGPKSEGKPGEYRKDLRRIYFQTPDRTHNTARYFKLALPGNMLESNNANDHSLVGELVAKKVITDPETGQSKKLVNKGVLWGDATTRLQKEIDEFHMRKSPEGRPHFSNTSWTIPPHHLSATKNQAVLAVDRTANGPDWSDLYVIGSSGRRPEQIPPQFGGTRAYRTEGEDPGERAPWDLSLTRDIEDNQVITVVTKPGYRRAYADDFGDMTRSIRSMTRSPKMENLAGELAETEGLVDPEEDVTNRYVGDMRSRRFKGIPGNTGNEDQPLWPE